MVWVICHILYQCLPTEDNTHCNTYHDFKAHWLLQEIDQYMEQVNLDQVCINLVQYCIATAALMSTKLQSFKCDDDDYHNNDKTIL